ncbi:hypothetical protein SLS62_004059 [Diatrype stigma]|uniref:Major facilitator superfamily (MFS) profile domain-containing protein n=1 Tax=Diatrype stigma TaxID=117547 RepID=A0AAN9URX4_9PEZI
MTPTESNNRGGSGSNLSTTSENSVTNGVDTPAGRKSQDIGGGGPDPEKQPPPDALTPGEKAPGDGEGNGDSSPAYSAFTTWEKRGIVLGAAVGALLSPLTGQIYLPALPVVAADLGVSIAQINLTMTTYMIFQGVTPIFIGSLADSAGRRPAYLICFVLFAAANVGCALAPTYAALLVLRMLQSAGAASTVALCQAVVADVVTSAERGSYVALTSLPALVGPSLGPVLGGVVSQYLGWRWIFWLLACVGGAVAAVHAAFLPETCRFVVGDGSARPPPPYRTLWQVAKDLARKRRRRRRERRQQLDDGGELGSSRAPTTNTTAGPAVPKKKLNLFKSLTLLCEVEMFVLLMYGGLVVATMYAVLTSMATHFASLYGLDETHIGLMYLPMTGGAIIVSLVAGRLQDWNFRRHCRLQGLPYDRRVQRGLAGFPIERARLEISAPLLAVSTLVVLSWGWALQYRAPIAVPCVLLFLLGFGALGFGNTLGVLITDINPGNAGAATASNNITRCLLSAVATAVIDPMTQAIGLGWAFVVFGALFAAGSPAVWLVMRYGVKWRREKEERRQRRKEKKKREKKGEGEGM